MANGWDSTTCTQRLFALVQRFSVKLQEYDPDTGISDDETLLEKLYDFHGEEREEAYAQAEAGRVQVEDPR